MLYLGLLKFTGMVFPHFNPYFLSNSEEIFFSIVSAVSMKVKVFYDICTRSNRRKNGLFNHVSAQYIFLTASNKDREHHMKIE